MNISILMSTYNGEKYIKQQISSILSQKDVDLKLIIRDDGSTDKTRSIIEEYSKTDKRIKCFFKKNVGIANSFFSLLRNAEPSDYYAFSDQDDVWLPEKISTAVNTLKDYPSDKPLLYYSNLYITDEELNVVKKMHRHPQNTKNRFNVFTEYYANGCTMVFNEKARELCLNHLPDNTTILHDAWIYMICGIMGVRVYDPNPGILYRQHRKNQVGAHYAIWDIIIQKMKHLFIKYDSLRRFHAKCFVDHFESLLCSSDKEKIDIIINYKKDLKRRMRLLFDRDIRCSSFGSDLKYRLLVLLGKA